MNQLTAIYYTAHTEPDWCEQRIRDTHLVTMGKLPLISVTQKPINFGRNICVGEVGISSQNAYRQFLIGAKAADTKFVCPIEADFLYPPEYFQFQPKRDNIIFVMTPVWIMFALRRRAHIFAQKPHGSEAAIIVGRLYFIDIMEKMLEGLSKWRINNEGAYCPHLFKVGAVIEEKLLPKPIVTFKTDNQMGRKVPYLKATRRRDVPYWGTWQEMSVKYLQR